MQSQIKHKIQFFLTHKIDTEDRGAISDISYNVLIQSNLTCSTQLIQHMSPYLCQPIH